MSLHTAAQAPLCELANIFIVKLMWNYLGEGGLALAVWVFLLLENN